MQNERILRRKEVETVTGLGRSVIYEKMAEGTFPQQVPLHGRSVGWVQSEVQKWVSDRITEARGVAA
jgi:prophage regulatory protein